MSIASVDKGHDVHDGDTYEDAYTKAPGEIARGHPDRPTDCEPHSEHGSAADDNIGEAVDDIGHAGTMPQPLKDVKMSEHQAPIVEQMDTNTITGLLHFIAIQAQTGDEQQKVEAGKVLGQIISGLPDAATVTLDDALTIQALAISLGHTIRQSADDPAKVLDLVSHMLFAVWSVARVLENLTGASVNDRRFFERQPTNTSVQ